MVVSDTPALFNLKFADRLLNCDAENIKVFLEATKLQTRVNSKSATRNFAYCCELLKEEAVLTIVDYDSQCRLSIYDQSAELVLARHICDRVRSLEHCKHIARCIADISSQRVDTDAKYRIMYAVL
jgi:hypothetical protein